MRCKLCPKYRQRMNEHPRKTGYTCRICGRISNIGRLKYHLPRGFANHLLLHNISYDDYIVKYHPNWEFVPKIGKCPTCGTKCATASGFCSPGCSLKVNRFETEIYGNWNAGLTKETDKRLIRTAPAWSKGLTKETDPRIAKISASCRRVVAEKKEKGTYVHWMQTEDSAWFRQELSEKAAKIPVHKWGDINAVHPGKGRTKYNDPKVAARGRKISRTKKKNWKKLSAKKRKEFIYARSYHFKQNKAEARLEKLCPKNVKFVGDGSFWITLNKKRCKNPDFIVRPFRENHRVIEFLVTIGILILTSLNN